MKIWLKIYKQKKTLIKVIRIKKLRQNQIMKSQVNKKQI